MSLVLRQARIKTAENSEVRQVWFTAMEPADLAPDTLDAYLISWHGALEKWAVTRRSDGHRMRQGFVSKREARYYIDRELQVPPSSRVPPPLTF